MIAQTRRSLGEVTKLAAAARAGNAPAAEHELTKLTMPYLRLLGAAARVGVRHCSSVG
jgi:hypothetical protein